MSKNISTGKEVTLLDVYQEFNEKVATKYKIFQFKSRKVEKKYGFEVAEVPLSSEYLEVRYSASDPVLPSDLQGSTFSHVFGTNTSALELLLLGRKIKGPCWLDVKEPQLVSNPVSWCRLETTSLKPENVSVSVLSPLPPPPPLVVVTLNVRSVLNPKTYQSEVVMIACLVHYAFNVDKAPPQPPFQQHFCAFTRPVGQPWPYDFREAMAAYTATKLERSDSERALLGFFLAKLSKIDPDLIVGHDLCGYDLDILVHRMTINKIPHWSRFGRLRRGNLASMGKNYIEKNATCGRLLCDMKISAKELVRSRSYDLGALCQNLANTLVVLSSTAEDEEIEVRISLLHLKENVRVNYTVEEVNKMFGSSRDLLHLISATMQDAVYILRLMCELNVLPLTLQITNIAVHQGRPELSPLVVTCCQPTQALDSKNCSLLLDEFFYLLVTPPKISLSGSSRSSCHSSQYSAPFLRICRSGGHIPTATHNVSVATVQYAPKSLRSTLLCNVMSRTLMGGRSERNEFLLLHAFTEKDFIVPDKKYKKSTRNEDFDLDEAVDSLGDPGKQRKGRSNRKKPSYLGGLVLEPKKGFYDKMILLMDFNSLYPSIIQEYNICFTTVPRAAVVNSQEVIWSDIWSNAGRAAECKEKWRNLRTVFSRKLKPLPSGSGRKKKAYYLADAMQFCVPFIKALAPPSSGNLPQIPQHETTEEIFENLERCDDESGSLEDSSDMVQSSQASSPPPPLIQAPSIFPPASPEGTVLPQPNRSKKSLNVRNKSAADADKCVAEYFKAKKARLETTANVEATSSHKIERKEALKMFLLSLIPEIEEFTDSQIKLFKRKIFSVIDEISTPSLLHSSSFITIDSPQSDSTHTSGISHTSEPSHTTAISPVSESLQEQASPTHQFYTDFAGALNSNYYKM
uniref:DNA-directed DNA polymerase n=1 Tax=Timema californicum TaxID=61474 RepID=A0A7R9J7C2_TIMCA|nr:unnamed protein product [Timema californicum]